VGLYQLYRREFPVANQCRLFGRGERKERVHGPILSSAGRPRFTSNAPSRASE
jgi:hypothetical protein